jgi:hypothetical protein
MEIFDHCPACNAELDDSTHCPGCGSAIPGRESQENTSSESAPMDLGFEVVQGADMAEDDFISTPPAAPPTPTDSPALPERVDKPVPTNPPGAQQEESPGIELESMVDPGSLQEAAAAGASNDGALELESMIAVPAPPVNKEPPPEAEDADDLIDLDLDLELIEPEAAKAPPPIAPKENTVRESKRQAGSAAPDSAAPDSAAPDSATPDSTAPEEERFRDFDPEDPGEKAKEKKKKIGFMGFVLRAALFAGVALGSLAIAYPPSIEILKGVVSEIPRLLGANGVRHVTNMLVDPIEVFVDDSLFGTLSPGEKFEIPVRAGDELRVRLIKPEQANGMRGGDDISFALSDPMMAGDDEHFQVDSHSGQDWIFAPLVSNTTGRDMRALINAGTGRARPCDCIIPAGASDHHIGYYIFEAGLRIRFVESGFNYDNSRYREVANVTADVEANTGAVSVRIPRR